MSGLTSEKKKTTKEQAFRKSFTLHCGVYTQRHYLNCFCWSKMSRTEILGLHWFSVCIDSRISRTQPSSRNDQMTSVKCSTVMFCTTDKLYGWLNGVIQISESLVCRRSFWLLENNRISSFGEELVEHVKLQELMWRLTNHPESKSEHKPYMCPKRPRRISSPNWVYFVLKFLDFQDTKLCFIDWLSTWSHETKYHTKLTPGTKISVDVMWKSVVEM